MKKVQIEICCGSAQDALEAWRGGADRVELCSALVLGGLTPSLGQMQVAKAAGGKVMAIVRPREGGFCYSETEFATMLADASAFVEAGADGVVFGVLHEDGTVDEGRCRAMMEVIGDRETVFHRAIDVTPDWHAALDSLMALGVTRVLTSGQAPDAIAGAETVRAMRQYARGRLQVLPGGGIRLHNAVEVLKQTGCAQLHLSLKKLCRDGSAAARPEIHFGAVPCEDETCYSMADREAIASLRAMVDGDAACI